MFPICLSIGELHPSFILSYGVSSIEVELWGWEANSSFNYCSAVLCSSTVCVYEMWAQPCVAVESRETREYWTMGRGGGVGRGLGGQGMVVREDHNGNEVMAGRAIESVGGVGVDAARRTGRGGDRGGVGGVLPAVSIQAMRGVEATTWQLLIAARQVCSTVQGIHLSWVLPES